jgi:hypothetical protein
MTDKSMLRRACTNPKRKRGIWLLYPSLALAAFSNAPHPLFAQSPSGLPQVAVGFNGKYKAGTWTPVSVTLPSASAWGELRLHVSDGDNVNSVTGRTVAAGGQPTQLFIRAGGLDGSLRVEFAPRDGGLEVWDFNSRNSHDPRYFPSALPSSHELIVNIGDDVGLDTLVSEHNAFLGAPGSSQGQRLHLARLDAPQHVQQLPTQWFGYEGVDVLALTTSQEWGESKKPLLSAFSGNDPRWQAMSQWVLQGGRLLIFGGGRSDDLRTVFQGLGPVGKLLPGKPKEDVRLLRAGQIESAYDGRHSFPLPRLNAKDPGSPLALVVPLLTDVQGKAEIAQDNVPLVVRAPAGFGEVVFVACDLNRPPFSLWEGRTNFLRGLLRKQRPGAEPQPAAAFSEATYVGITDLSGQLRGALDQFAGISPTPFVLVALLALAYILLIGPVDYLLVKKLWRRPELTWVTFPLMVLAVSLVAYGLAHRLKGRELRVNQLDVFDFDQATGQVRGQTWFNVFSPESRVYDVAVRPDVAGPSAASAYATVVSWLGLPGDAMGGMDRQNSAGGLGGTYRFSPDYKEMLGVPLQVWSSKSFTARWLSVSGDPVAKDQPADAKHQPADAGRSPAEGIVVKVVSQRGGLEHAGTISNRFDFPLSECLFVTENRAYDLGELRPGQTVSLAGLTRTRTLKSLLHGEVYRTEDSRRGVHSYFGDYDRLGFNVPEIVKQMTFYEESDGRSFTKLLNRYQPQMDLSHLLDARFNPKRGIFFGFAERRTARIILNGQPAGDEQGDKAWTCYRVVAAVGQ